MKRSRITDDSDVDLDNLQPGDGNNASGGTGAEGEGEDDELPEGDDDPEDDAEDDDTGDGEDDEGEDDGEGDDDGTGGRRADGESEPPRGRANARIRSLRTENRALEGRLTELQGKFDAFVSGRQTNPQPQQTQQETPEQRNARRALMSREERLEEDVQNLTTMVTTSHRQTQTSVADATDKAGFDAKVATDPLYRKWAPKVEAERAKLAGQGVFVAREAILRYQIGEAALQSRGAGTKTQKAVAQRRLARQTVKPGDSRNDASQSRRGGANTLEKRLENVPL